MPKAKLEDLLKVKRFSTLGGLTQHMESGRCACGLEMYTKAISFVEEKLKTSDSVVLCYCRIKTGFTISRAILSFRVLYHMC
jgi:hypothetical protein